VQCDKLSTGYGVAKTANLNPGNNTPQPHALLRWRECDGIPAGMADL